MQERTGDGMRTHAVTERLIGTGTKLEVYPQSSTTYYVRSENGVCYSGCITVELIIPGSLNNAGTITTTPGDTICNGGSVTIGVTNSLTGGNWYWYLNGCGGTLSGTGYTLTVTPAVTTIYSVRQELGTMVSSCMNRQVVVNTLSLPAITMTAVNDTICQGQNTTLGKTGGLLGTMGIWKWYTGTCGGTLSGTGNTITVNPVVTTVYYIRAEGICNTTQCVNLTVTVNDTSVSSTGITSSETVICEGTTITMNENGGMPGTAANWQWYSGTCGGAPEGNGTTLTGNTVTDRNITM